VPPKDLEGAGDKGRVVGLRPQPTETGVLA